MTTPREIVERLRHIGAPVLDSDGLSYVAPPPSHEDRLEAASTIERLVEALEQIGSLSDLEMKDGDAAREIARRALTGGE